MKKQLSKFAFMATLMLAITFTLSCSGGDDGGDVSSSSGGNNGGDANHDSRIVNAANEAWLQGASCASATKGFILMSDGEYIKLSLSSSGDGTWSTGDARTWRTEGDKFIVTKNSDVIATYALSNGILTVDGEPFRKCPVTHI